MSLIVPGDMAIMTAPKNAPKNRTMINSWRELPMPQGMIKMVVKAMPTMYTGRRPYISDMGARTMEPSASPNTE